MKKKNVLITGASRGLGKALAQVFADNDYNLILHSKDRDLPCVNKSFKWTDKHESDRDVYCETVKGDITRMETVYRLLQVAREMGGVDVLINNAGIHVWGSFEQVDSLEYAEMIQVNLLAPMLLTKHLWGCLKEKKGLVLFINSIAGKVGADKEFMYCASKHGLKGFSDSIQFDATRAGVKVMSIYLGALKTDMSKHREDYDKLMEPVDAANLIYDMSRNYGSMRVTEVDVCRRNY